ncbi:type VII secretion-associated serine protease mycosin [Actinoplanes sp. N902-109]|uniref:type VII secretion-associated serine protease mycosin n=1 Tax=Actinoplanes sp. (strain N902-109) TaxID=649831 RepID=UPI001E314F75|nr:type VII secretion-associated serine protease mycosin [Actinoplanes sp. N902-109]
MIRSSIAFPVAALVFASAASMGSPAFADGIRDAQWHLRVLKVAEAQKISSGQGVTVAVIDTGVAPHPDLSSNLLDGADLTSGGESGHDDSNGHGTAMAGLIAAHGRNGNGALGVAPEAKILPIKVMLNKGKALDIGSAIDYAVRNGAQVINMSLGGSSTGDMIAAINRAVAADVVLVAAAGNRPEDSGVVAPAILPQVLAVGATDRSGNLSEVSVRGPQLDIVAPGEDIETIRRGGGYSSGRTGTSDSAAIVSGAAALLRSKYPDMSAADVVKRLEDTAVDKGSPGVDDEYGHGVLDIVAALKGKPAGSGQGSSSAAAPGSGSASERPGGVAVDESEGSSSGGAGLLVGGVVLVVLLGGVGLFWGLRRRGRAGAG